LRLRRSHFSVISAAFDRPASEGCRGDPQAFHKGRPAAHGAALIRNPRSRESKMPKLKTHSGAKKRFKITATGKVKYQQSGKRHGMIKRTKKQIRDHRGTRVMFKSDGDNIIQYRLPNSR
jgi:large subunit ribosomal protein L35